MYIVWTEWWNKPAKSCGDEIRYKQNEDPSQPDVRLMFWWLI